jgi:hypothetical protein
MSYYAHHFSAPLEIHRVGRYRYRVVYLPPALATALPFDRQPRVRFDGEIADVPVQGAWQSAGAAGRWYAMVSPAVCRAAGSRSARSWRSASTWRTRTPCRCPRSSPPRSTRTRSRARRGTRSPPGRRRGLAYRVAAARKEATRHARAAELIAGLRAGQLPGPPPRSRAGRR